MFILTKRRKFVLSSLLLSAGLYFLEIIGFEWKYQAIGLLSILAGFLTFWSLRGAAFGLATLITPILPVFFTLGIALFNFLLPGNILTVASVLVIYFFGMYAVFLTENIFSVAAIRTINLFRSALAVGFLMTLLVSFFLYNTVISFKLPFYFNFLAILFFSFPLVLAGLWSVKLEERLTLDLLLPSVAIAFFLGQLALVISFWPVTVTMGSLFLTSVLYVLLGLAQAERSGRLFKRMIVEYLGVGAVVFLIMCFSTEWG